MLVHRVVRENQAAMQVLKPPDLDLEKWHLVVTQEL